MPSINIRWLLFVASLAVMESAAAAMDATGPSSPMASVNVTNTVASQDVILQWLKITAVPFGVFLFGACTWGCIKNTPAWRNLIGREGESEADEMPADEPSNYNDLEVGSLEVITTS